MASALVLTCAVMALTNNGVRAEPAAGSTSDDTTATTTTTASAAACANASTVVVGATDSDAIAYDASCKAYAYRVVKPSAGARQLNLSSLDVAAVRTYPRVYTLFLNDNDLTALQAGTDMDMSHLCVLKLLFCMGFIRR